MASPKPIARPMKCTWVRQALAAGIAAGATFLTAGKHSVPSSLRIKRKESQTHRSLGGYESLFNTSHELGLGLIYCIVDLAGPGVVTSELLRKAALLCLKRHPALRVVLKYNEMANVSYEDYPHKITIDVEEEKTPEEVAEEELNKMRVAMASGNHPLWKLHLINVKPAEGAEEDKPKQHLLMIAHHSLIDGHSRAMWLQELLEHMEALESANDESAFETMLAAIQPKPMLPSLDTLLKRSLRQSKNQDHEAVTVRGYRNEFVRRWKEAVGERPEVPAPEVKVPLEERRNRILTKTFDREKMARLAARCKEENCTVTAALAVAAMRAIKTQMGKDKKSTTIRMDTACSMRELAAQATPEVRDSLGAFLATLDGHYTVSDDDDFYAQAKAYREGLKADLDRGRISVLLKMYRLIQNGTLRPALMATVNDDTSGRIAGFLLSNLGKMDHLIPRGRRFSFSRTRSGISITGYGAYAFLSSLTLNGELHLTMTTVDPIVSTERAHYLIDNIMAELERATDLPRSNEAATTSQ